MLFADFGYRRDCKSASAVDKDLAIWFLEVESVSHLYFDYLAVTEVLRSLARELHCLCKKGR